jgi:hypothetical protein
MNKFSKHNDIEAVMIKAKQSLGDIEHKYQRYLRKENIPENLLVEIKDCLSNLRSALDYIWHKIPGVSGSNFPVANSHADFINKVSGLDKKHIYVLERWQYYDNDSWIKNFNIFRNKNIHLTLIPQKRRETREFSIKKDGAGITARGCTFQGRINFGVGGVTVPIDEKTQFPADVPGVDINRMIWVDFLFDGSLISPDLSKGISVLPFLKESFTNVSKIICELESLV